MSRKRNPNPTMTIQEARERNYKIMRLRGMWGTAAGLISDKADVAAIQKAVDVELALLGAETCVEQRARWRRERELFFSEGLQEGSDV